MVGVLNSGPVNARSLEATRQGLRELGYVEGQTIVLDVLRSTGKPEALPAQASSLVDRKVDVILAIGPAALRAASAATRAIPILAYDLESDPVKSRFAKSLAQPGGNVTGLFLDLPALAGKWFELIRDARPDTRRVAALWDSTTGDQQLGAARAAAQGLGIEVEVIEVRTSADLDKALRSGPKGRPGSLVLLSSPLFEAYARPIADYALKHRLTGISISTRFTEAGGLLAYGPVRSVFGPRLAVYIDKMLKGAKPGDLPIEQPTVFELVVNLRTAEALGLTLPPTLLARADQVIR